MYMGTLRRHIILWLLLVPVGLCGQKNTPVTVTCENRFVGRDCVSGDSIPAVLYRFNRRVERIPVLDTVAGRAIVQFRDITKNGKYLEPVGPMISMELSDGAVLWQRDIGYIFGHTWIDEELIVETDLQKSRRIDLETGTDLWEKKIRLNREEECEHCHGTGAAEGSHPETCPDCHGTGEVRVTQNSIFGQVVNVRTCSRCHGTGQIVTNPCKYCRGTGRVKQKRVITVKIPAGVDSGSRLRVAGEGEAGMRGGRAGDLYVYLYVKSHKFFERDGTTVLCEVPISIVQAALGAEIKVPTLYGQTTIKVPEGTQPNRVLRIKGKGIPNLRTGVKGDQLIQIKVVVPTRLSDAQKEALRKFADASGESINPEEKSFFNKVKDFFDKKDKK